MLQPPEAAGTLPPPPPASTADAAPPPPPLDPRALYSSELTRFVDALKAIGAAAADTDAGASSHRPSFSVASIVLQEYEGVSAPAANHPHILLHGLPAVRESLCGLQFDISPGAFFQVNTPAAERLYYLARALSLDGVLGGKRLVDSLPRGEHGGAGAASSSSSLASDAAAVASSSGSSSSDGAISVPTTRRDFALLDVCCGTGTIGLVCSPFFGRVVGVELSEEAVEDARRNQRLNGVANALFVCNKAEAVMKEIIPIAEGGAAPPSLSASSSAAPAASAASAAAAGVPPSPASLPSTLQIYRVVAIVDPPRAGLHPDVVRALRTCKSLKRVVYVSCNPTGSLIEDALRLCLPQAENSKSKLKGPPFTPRLAVPVDLFPHTPHCEMVMLFERD
jgi:tRNA (uracil-5-)-methyltransferase